MKPEQVEDWIENGPPCLNCGERVPDAERFGNPPDGIGWRGICRSRTCRELPPGGNPFMYMLGA
jgi:hypothetical protein